MHDSRFPNYDSRFPINDSDSRMSNFGLNRIRVRGRCVCGSVIQNAIAVVTSDELFATPNLGHRLWSKRHETSSAGSISRLSDGDAIANASTDSFVLGAQLFWQSIKNSISLADANLKLVRLGLC